MSARAAEQPLSGSSRRVGRLGALTATPARAGACVATVAIAAAAAHILIDNSYHGPWVFDDELGYQKLAQSFAATGHFALFGKAGLSYSPLYPLILAPLYRLDLSGPEIYQWTKIVNAVLMAVAIFPIYRIARFVLPPSRAVVAAGRSALAPLMLYSQLEMSENAAFPLAMFALWAILVAIRSPGWPRDAVVVGIWILAAAARLQLVVLLPAAFIAVAIEAALRGGGAKTVARRVLREHRLLVAATAIGAVLALAAIAGTQVLSLAGQYSQQLSMPTPSPVSLARLVLDHVAGLDLALGVIPFVGTLVAAYVWAGRRTRRDVNAFAAMSLSVTALLVVLVAFTAYQQSSGSDLPRIHERYLIYVLPLFVISLLAVVGPPRTSRLLRVALGAAVAAALLPTVIPYGSFVNDTVGADTFGLSPFVGRAADGGIQALPYSAAIVAAYALCLGLVFALARPNAALVLAAAAAALVFVSAKAHTLLDVGARAATAQTLPVHKDWIDAAGPKGGVLILESARHTRRLDLAVAETAFYNLSVSRLLYVCSPLLLSQYGEIQTTLDGSGRLREGAAPVHARYVVGPRGAGLVGRRIARDAPGRLVLVEPAGGIVRVAAGHERDWRCSPPG